MTKSPSRKKATLIQLIGGYLNTVIVVIQGLILIPLYINYIGLHTYGLWLASGGVIGMLGMINFGFGSMMIQRIASSYSSKDFAGISRYFTNGLIVYFLICLLYFVIGRLFSSFMPLILNISGDEARLLVVNFNLMIIGMMIAIFNECLKGLSQSLLRPLVPLISMIIGRVLGIVVTIWMLTNDFGLSSIPTGFVVTEVIIFIVNFIYSLRLSIKHSLFFYTNLETIKEYISMSPFFFMTKVGNIISIQSQPLFITMFIGPEITSIYMIIRRAAEIMLYLMRVINASIMGTFAHLFNDSDKNKSSEVAEIILTATSIVGIIGFSVYVAMNNNFVLLWIDNNLIIDNNLTIAIALSFLATALRGIMGQMLYGIGDFKTPSVIALFEGLFAALMSIIFLNFFGVIGVAVSLLLSSVISILIISARVKEKILLRVEIKDVIKLILAAIFVFSLSYIFSLESFKIDTWALFTFTLISSAAVVSTVLLLLNFKKCAHIYKWLVN
jgi:O-antigen/teichoic acid export membrane protein